MFKLESFNIISQSISSDEIPFNEIDYFICASGFEKRASYQSKLFLDLTKKRIVYAFDNEQSHVTRIINDAYYKKNNFSFRFASAENNDRRVFDELIEEIRVTCEKSKECTVFIDYSSMTKSWYSYLLLRLFYLNDKNRLTLYLGYSHPKYVEEDIEVTNNRVVVPLYGYSSLNLPTKPTALLIGIGNEPNRVFGLREYFDAITYLFYSDNSFNKDFHNATTTANQDIIKEIPDSNIFEIPINDLIYCYYVLNNICSDLINRNRVIIAPCGPKPFTVLSLLLSLKFKDKVDVWRISPGVKQPIFDKEPSGFVSILKVAFDEL